jgi:hemolysin D
VSQVEQTRKVPAKPPTVPAKVSAGFGRVLPHVDDRAFLPAAVEIIETPPSPHAVAMTLAICGFFAAALAWCWFGRLDVYATARGKIEPAGHAKIVGSLDPGKVASIDATEGKVVHEGDALVALDTSEPAAEFASATQAMVAAKAEAIRRQAALQVAATGDWSRSVTADWPDDIPAESRAREESVLHGDLQDQAAKLANLAAQKVEKEAAVRELDASIAAEHRLIETLNERVALRQALIDKDVGTRTALLDAIQALRQEEAQLAGDIGKRDAAIAAVKSVDTQYAETTTGFISDQTSKMATARRLADEKAADRVKAKVRIDRMTMRAPVDGVVQSLAVTTIGQVVTTGQELMSIVPSNTPVQILAYVTNDDIGFVTPGQDAVVKIDSFPFTQYGTIGAVVDNVASDAIPTDTANRRLSDPTKAGDSTSQSLTPTARPTTDLVFEARLNPQSYAINVNGRNVPLSPGMTVTVEIKTGSRRILEYLFSPLVEVAGKAMRER